MCLLGCSMWLLADKSEVPIPNFLVSRYDLAPSIKVNLFKNHGLIANKFDV